MNSIQLSVIVCTYNPNRIIFEKVLEALKNQTLLINSWEIILVDNNSDNSIEDQFDLIWFQNLKVVIEKEQGLAKARIKGVKNAIADLIVFIDDDNLPDVNFLSNCLKIAENNPSLGIYGGKAIPEFFEGSETSEMYPYWGLVGCRDLGDEIKISEIVDSIFSEYPSFSPIGTGMVIRKSVFMSYVEEIQNNSFRKSLGRSGKQLTSGEDNDIVITALKNGWQVGYFPQLVISHYIPKRRTTIKYLSKMNFAQQKSWVQLLAFHNLSPWPLIPKWSLIFRKQKAYFTCKAWGNEQSYINWKGACGMFEGLIKGEQ